MKILFHSMLLVPMLLAVDAGQAAEPLDVREWLVPWEGSVPRDPYVDDKGRVWFCGQRGNYIAYLVPDTGEFKRYEVESGTHPHNLIVDRDGFVWYAGNRNAHIGRLDPANGEIKKYPMPAADARDPHTMVFASDGNIWFTLQQSNMIGHLDTRSGEVRLVDVPTPRARPYGIKVDTQDRPWIVLLGTSKLATIDPATLELTEIALPRLATRPRRLETGANGNVWYVDYAGGFLGRYSPKSQETTEWELPSGKQSRPYGTALDDKGNIWIAETGISPNRLVGFDTDNEEFFGGVDIPSGAGTIRHMYFHPASREIWFGTDTNYVGRLAVP